MTIEKGEVEESGFAGLGGFFRRVDAGAAKLGYCAIGGRVVHYNYRIFIGTSYACETDLSLLKT